MFPLRNKLGLAKASPFFSAITNGGTMTEKQINDLFDLLKKRDEEICLGMEAMRINLELLSQRVTVASERLEILEDINSIMSGNYGSITRNSGRA